MLIENISRRYGFAIEVMTLYPDTDEQDSIKRYDEYLDLKDGIYKSIRNLIAISGKDEKAPVLAYYSNVYSKEEILIGIKVNPNLVYPNGCSMMNDALYYKIVRLIIYILENPDWNTKIMDLMPESSLQALENLALTHLLVREALDNRFKVSDLLSLEHLFDDETIETYTDLDCGDLAVEIANQTGLDVYALYNIYEKASIIYKTGHNHIHYVVKLKSGMFVDITGVSDLEMLNKRWCDYVHREKPDLPCKIGVEIANDLTEDYCVSNAETKKIAKIIVANIQSYL